MPQWLIAFLLNIAIKIGVPALIKYLPWIPKEVVDIINMLLDELKKPEVSNSSAKKKALKAVRDLQVSPGPQDLVE